MAANASSPANPALQEQDNSSQPELEQAQLTIRNLENTLRETTLAQHAAAERHVEALSKQKAELEAHFSQLVSHDKCYEIAHSLEAQHQKLKEIYEQKLRDAQRYVVQRLETQENDLKKVYEGKLEDAQRIAEDARQEHIKDTVRRLQAKEQSFAEERRAAAARLEAIETAAKGYEEENAALRDTLEDAQRTTSDRTRKLEEVQQTVTELQASVTQLRQERDDMSEKVLHASAMADREKVDKVVTPGSQSGPMEDTPEDQSSNPRKSQGDAQPRSLSSPVASDAATPANNEESGGIDISINAGVSRNAEDTAGLAQQVSDLTRELDEARSQNSELLLSISRYATQQDILKQELEGEKQASNDVKCSASAEKKTFEQRLLAVENDMAEEHESHNKALRAAHGQIHQLQTELDNRDAAPSRDDIAQKDQQSNLQLVQTESQLNLAQVELQIALDSLAEKEREIEFVEESWAEDKDEIEELHSRLEAANDDLISSRKTIAELQHSRMYDAKEQESIRKELRVKTGQLEEQRTTFDHLKKRYLGENERLKHELAITRSNIEDEGSQKTRSGRGTRDAIDDIIRRRERTLANNEMSPEEKEQEFYGLRSSLESLKKDLESHIERINQLRANLIPNEESAVVDGAKDNVDLAAHPSKRGQDEARDGDKPQDDANLVLFKDNSNLKWAEAVVHLVRIRYSLENELNIKDKFLGSQQEKIISLKKQINNLGDSEAIKTKTASPRPNETDRKLQGTPTCAESKGKDDEYFVHQFAKLSLMVAKFSKTHFSFPPTNPLADILAGIPDGLPSFFDNTLTAYELRCTYIQHVVNKHLTNRIFKPFLFTLDRHDDNASRLLESIDADIYRKSTRREVFWRQQTLLALFTSRDAKRAMNHAVTTITEEITNVVRPFTDSSRVPIDTLRGDVRHIVKHAAKTWRQARLQQQLIVAVMPSVDDERTTNHVWAEFNYECEAGSITARDWRNTRSKAEDNGRRLLLRVAPRVGREPAHPDHLAEMSPEASQRLKEVCIYQPGSLIYADSPIITARVRELAEVNLLATDDDAIAEDEGEDEENGGAVNDNGTILTETAVASQTA